MTKIVTDSSEITADWLQAALCESEAFAGAVIEGCTVEPVGGGVIARMARAHLTLSGGTGAPTSVLVKYASDDPGSFGLAQAMGFYELETRFYQDVAPLMPEASVPRSFASAHDADSGQFTIVIEDLSAVTRPGDQLTERTLAECESALSELAKFQAPTWNSPQVAALTWLSDPTRTQAIFDGLTAGLEPFIARFGQGLDPRHLALIESVLPKAGEWVRSWSAPNVVQHGDFRSDNLLFGTTPSAPPVTVIDFQTIRLGPPGVDAAYFIASSLSPENRRASDRELIAGYHKQLVASGVDDFDFDACWSAYREGALYGVFLFVGMGSQVEATERGDRIIVEQIARYAEMAIDLESAQAAGLA